MFTFPALLWFLPLAGVVVLIHLVTMFRYRPVPWAAMEFLLAGYKRTRTRILLRQLLLMLLRTLAVVVLILMLAGPKLAGPLAELFGGRPTHHIVLLDDSYSMSERNALQGGNTVFEEAVGTVRRIVQTGVKSGGSDRMTLLLASRSRKIALGEEPEFAERPMDARGAADMEARLQTLEV
ncbi:MAG TPA: hypothetical protein DEB39_01315, partial [Planctomycetaceae bacterium]|nr:hypothetical protein [Planctomycetaceae bacterium]